MELPFIVLLIIFMIQGGDPIGTGTADLDIPLKMNSAVN